LDGAVRAGDFVADFPQFAGKTGALEGRFRPSLCYSSVHQISTPRRAVFCAISGASSM
jgi:hypothetical protein